MKTEIICILDASSSMGGMVTEVLAGYAKFVAEQKAVPGEARITLVEFSSGYKKCFEGQDLARHSGVLDYRPDGMTAMYNGVGRTLNEQGQRIAREKWADLVIVCIITDGAENASREYDQPRVAAMVKHAEDHGWKFLFLASNIDAKQGAMNIGSSAQLVGNFAATAAGMAQTYGSASLSTTALRNGANLQNLVRAPDDQEVKASMPKPCPAVAQSIADYVKDQQTKKTTLVPGVAWPSK